MEIGWNLYYAARKRDGRSGGRTHPRFGRIEDALILAPPLRFSDLAPSLNEKMSHMNLYKAIKVTSLEQLSLDEFSGKKISKRSKHFWEECTLIYADVTLLKDGSEHNFIFSFTIY